MVQRHSIILWKEPETRDFSVYTEEAYQTLEVLMKHNKLCYPTYETGIKKKEAKPIDWEYSKFCEIVMKNATKDSDELGYNVSFFSSLKNDESASISFSIGIRNAQFVNTCIVKLPVNLEIFHEDIYNEVSEIFSDCVKTFRPFWGCVSNDRNARSFGAFLNGNKPSTVHWMNYWSESICKEISERRIQKVIERNSQILFQDNIFKVRNNPLDITCEEDMQLQRALNSLLKL